MKKNSEKFKILRVFSKKYLPQNYSENLCGRTIASNCISFKKERLNPTKEVWLFSVKWYSLHCTNL